MDNQEIIQRSQQLESERKGTVDQVWDLIERFVVPLRGDFYTSLNSEGEVDWHRRQIYDSTAVFAAQALAASLHGNLTSPSQRWFELRFRDDDLNNDDGAKEWLEDSTNRIYYALQESNFDVEIAEAYLDMVTFGTTVINEEEEDDNTLLFSAIPAREVHFEEDHRKNIFRLYRILRWTPQQIISKFGDKVPQKIKDQANDVKSNAQRHKIVFCLFPRDVNIDTSKLAPPEARPWGYKYVLASPVEMLGEEGGYYEMPSFVARWRKVAGSRWGHSPANIALADILQLNQVIEQTIEATSKAIDPPMIAESNVLQGNVDLDPGGLTIVQDRNGFGPLDAGSRFDVSNLEVSRLQQSIRQAFYQDQLELKESPAMTATEVNVRYELMQRLLGPTLGRLKTDLLDPLIERTFMMMFRAGKFKDMPEQISGIDLDIDYLGPLARAQRSDTAVAIIQTMTEFANLAEIMPELRDRFDPDKASLMLARLRGVPAEVMRSEQELVDKRKEDAEKAQMMSMAQMGQETGAALKAVGEGAQSLQAVNE